MLIASIASLGLPQIRALATRQASNSSQQRAPAISLNLARHLANSYRTTSRKLIWFMCSVEKSRPVEITAWWRPHTAAEMIRLLLAVINECASFVRILGITRCVHKERNINTTAILTLACKDRRPTPIRRCTASDP